MNWKPRDTTQVIVHLLLHGLSAARESPLNASTTWVPLDIMDLEISLHIPLSNTPETY